MAPGWLSNNRIRDLKRRSLGIGRMLNARPGCQSLLVKANGTRSQDAVVQLK
jgi:hypothetical protein